MFSLSFALYALNCDYASTTNLNLIQLGRLLLVFLSLALSLCERARPSKSYGIVIFDSADVIHKSERILCGMAQNTTTPTMRTVDNGTHEDTTRRRSARVRDTNKDSASARNNDRQREKVKVQSSRQVGVSVFFTRLRVFFGLCSLRAV